MTPQHPILVERITDFRGISSKLGSSAKHFRIGSYAIIRDVSQVGASWRNFRKTILSSRVSSELACSGPSGANATHAVLPANSVLAPLLQMQEEDRA